MNEIFDMLLFVLAPRNPMCIPFLALLPCLFTSLLELQQSCWLCHQLEPSDLQAALFHYLTGLGWGAWKD